MGKISCNNRCNNYNNNPKGACSAESHGYVCTLPVRHKGPHIACGTSEALNARPEDHNLYVWER